jgi:hypothetical protein
VLLLLALRREGTDEMKIFRNETIRKHLQITINRSPNATFKQFFPFFQAVSRSVCGAKCDNLFFQINGTVQLKFMDI